MLRTARPHPKLFGAVDLSVDHELALEADCRPTFGMRKFREGGCLHCSRHRTNGLKEHESAKPAATSNRQRGTGCCLTGVCQLAGGAVGAK